MTVELGGTTLSQLTNIEVREQARLVRHPVPGLSGDLLQVQGRPSVEVRFVGVFYGPTAADDLGKLRTAYLNRQPIDFFTESVGQGYFSQVIISRLEVTQRAGYLDEFDYICEVLEYVEPPQPAAADLLGSIDTGLLDDASGFMDDVQNGLAEVSSLANLVGNIPVFNDPTTQLGQMLNSFQPLASSGASVLGNLKDLF